MNSEKFINKEALNSIEDDFNMQNLPVEYGSVTYSRFKDKNNFCDYFFSMVDKYSMTKGVFILVNPGSIHYSSRSVNSNKALTLFMDISINKTSDIKYEYVGLI